MQIGSIIFIRGHSIFSDIIRYFDPGNFSHVAISVSPNGTHVLESQRFINTRITPFYFDDYEVIDLGLTDQQKTKLVHLSIQMCGKNYDYLQLLKYALDDFGINLKLNNPNKFICSELISTVLYGIGKIKGDEWIRDLSPNELYQYLTSSKKGGGVSCQ